MSDILTSHKRWAALLFHWLEVPRGSGTIPVMDAEQWVKGLIGSDTVNAAAVKAEITPPTLFRQIKKGTLSVESVILLCRAYGRSPVSGLVETGYLTAEEARRSAVEYALRNATNEQLAAEILRRMNAATRGAAVAEERPARAGE